MFGWEADLESSNSYFIKVTINLVEHLPIPFSRSEEHTSELQSLLMISMVLTIEVLVSLFRISHHLVGPFEEGFVLDFFQYLMHWLSKYSSDHLNVI